MFLGFTTFGWVVGWFWKMGNFTLYFTKGGQKKVGHHLEKAHIDSKMCSGPLRAIRTRIRPVPKPSRHFAHLTPCLKFKSSTFRFSSLSCLSGMPEWTFCEAAGTDSLKLVFWSCSVQIRPVFHVNFRFIMFSQPPTLQTPYSYNSLHHPPF